MRQSSESNNCCQIVNNSRGGSAMAMLEVTPSKSRKRFATEYTE